MPAPPPINHVGCILTIVGSRRFLGFAWRGEALLIIGDALTRHNPVLVISGGAPGIDQMAEDIAKNRGFATTVVRPQSFTWDGEHGLKARNTQMAEACQCLVRIASRSSTTYGSGWTADYAERTGKFVERYLIGDEPKDASVATDSNPSVPNHLRGSQS